MNTCVLLQYRVAVTTQTLLRLRLVKQLLHCSFTAGIDLLSSYVLLYAPNINCVTHVWILDADPLCLQPLLKSCAHD